MDRHTLETDPNILGNLIYGKVGMIIQWEKDALFIKSARITHSMQKKASLDP